MTSFLSNILLPFPNLNDLNSRVVNIYNIFWTKLLKTIDKHAPFKILSQKRIKYENKPWIIKQILTKIKEKNKTFEKYL